MSTFVEAHPWWSLVYLVVAFLGTTLLISALRARPEKCACLRCRS